MSLLSRILLRLRYPRARARPGADFIAANADPATPQDDRFRQVFLASPDSIAVVRLDDSTFVEVNEGYAPFTTRLGQGGSGLGLHIVHNIVTGLLGGQVAVTSQPGEGTVFTLRLPRRAPATAMAPDEFGAIPQSSSS